MIAFWTEMIMTCSYCPQSILYRSGYTFLSSALPNLSPVFALKSKCFWSHPCVFYPPLNKNASYHISVCYQIFRLNHLLQLTEICINFSISQGSIKYIHFQKLLLYTVKWEMRSRYIYVFIVPSSVSSDPFEVK